MSLPGPLFPSFSSDPHFDSGLRTAKRAGVGIGCILVVQLLGGLALAGAVVAVAWHFIAKFW